MLAFVSIVFEKMLAFAIILYHHLLTKYIRLTVSKPIKTVKRECTLFITGTHIFIYL